MIILAATPIGNLGDASARLKDALERAVAPYRSETGIVLPVSAKLCSGRRP